MSRPEMSTSDTRTVRPDLSKYFYSGEPGSLSAPATLKAVGNVQASKTDIANLYSEDRTLRQFYNIPRVTKKHVHHVKAYAPGTVYQMDTLDLSYESARTAPLALIIVCCYSRYTHVEGLKNRGFQEMKRAMESFWKVVAPFEKFPSQKHHTYLTDAGG